MAACEVLCLAAGIAVDILLGALLPSPLLRFAEPTAGIFLFVFGVAPGHNSAQALGLIPKEPLGLTKKWRSQLAVTGMSFGIMAVLIDCLKSYGWVVLTLAGLPVSLIFMSYMIRSSRRS